MYEYEYDIFNLFIVMYTNMITNHNMGPNQNEREFSFDEKYIELIQNKYIFEKDSV